MSPAGLSLPGVIHPPTTASWDDLILPQECLGTLREFILWVTQREKVEDQWEGRAIGGPIAMLAGPSGTGKTFAAELLANALKLDLCRVDLSLLLSKYIGETEKALDALFSALAREPMLLLFDEADSLFGKRSEIRDAHDRYSNIEVSYLLSRLEYHKGPVLFTSKCRDRIDVAFIRRLQFVIEFPLPNPDRRSRLWRLYLPAKAPIDKDVDMDGLARDFELTGGQIRSAALHAAFLAAGESSPISREHISAAVEAELAKSANE